MFRGAPGHADPAICVTHVTEICGIGQTAAVSKVAAQRLSLGDPCAFPPRLP